MMQLLKMISSLVVLVQPLRTLSRLLARPLGAITRGVRPTTRLTRVCYALLGIALLLGALGAERAGQRGYAIALSVAGTILLFLPRIAPLVAMRGAVRWYNALKGFGYILPDGGQDLFVHVRDIVGFGPWFRSGARVAFKTRGGEYKFASDRAMLAGRCLQVTSIQDDGKSAQDEDEPFRIDILNDGAQKPSDLLRTGWARKGVAVDGHGEPVLSDSPTAVAWSLSGAVNAVFEPDSPEWRSYMGALQALVGHNLVRWNGDSDRTQEEVVAVALETERSTDGL